MTSRHGRLPIKAHPVEHHADEHAEAQEDRRTDKREQAQEHVATATTLYRDMGMTYWREQAEAVG